MKRIGVWVVVAMLAMGARAQEPAAAPKAVKPISAIAWVVGGVWTADTSKLGGGMQRIETQYQWSDNGAYIRFTTHFISDQGTFKNYDGSFYWEPAEKTLRVWYMDAASVITQAQMTVDGELWVMRFRAADFAGKQAEMRVEVTRKSNDLYHWTLNEQDGAGWKKLLELDYVRKAG